MGFVTGIGWTDRTWNPWHGCHHVSLGCEFCYMFRDKVRFGQNPEAVVRSKSTFRDPLKWKKPSRIFTCSWSDFFIREADPWRDEAMEIMMLAAQHTYQVLTKRPERMANYLTRWLAPALLPTILEHVWLGVSCESADFKYRLDVLRATPAVVRWVSFEPLLGDLGELDLRGINWAVFGGESGSTRVMGIDWLRRGVEQCREQGVAVFVKQDSGPHPGQQGRIPDDLWQLKEFPR